MTYRPGKHVYLAGPFFTDDQRALCEFIEQFETPQLPIYSPRLDGGVLKKDSNQEQQRRIFDENVLSIETARLVLAVIDDFDTGTIWEMGCAFAKGIHTVAYSDVPGRGLNVMLSQGCAGGFVNGRTDLGEMLTLLSEDPTYWPQADHWRGDIQ